MGFTHAIARLPAATCVQGLTSVDLGAPDPRRTRAQFDAYIDALLQMGLTVTLLPAQPAFPDAHFVEDTAVVTPELAFITRPGAPSRAGEVATIEPALAHFRPIARMNGDGRIDGGDVLLVDRRFFVGLSGRTDTSGAKALARTVEPYGYAVTEVPVSAGLHLKSAVNYVGRSTLLLGKDAAREPAFAGFDHIVLPHQELYAGNTLWINDTLITPDGFPETHRRLARLNMPIVRLDMSEFQKMDGGLTCLSLRF